MKTRNFILFLMFFYNTIFAQVDLTLSHDRASTSDYITLTFISSGNAQKFIPNFSYLKKDFNIISSSQSSQVSIINGQVNRQNEWQIIVNAKKKGLLTIPRIQFGNEYSPEKQITISKSSALKNNNNGSDLFMTASTNIKQPYVQQQIIYNVKFFYQRRPSSGEFTSPELQNAVISPIGKNKNYRTVRQGESYNVAELSFVVFAEKSGKLTLKSPVFNGTIRPNRIHNINQLLADVHQPIHLSAPDLTLNIKPIPDEFKGKTWLPASNISIEESWQQSSIKAIAGEPITRIIKIKAEGLMASQLPELSFPPIEGTKIYPEPSTSNDTTMDQKVIGEKTFKVVYIPIGNQNINVPEITISWWNTTTNKTELVKLKEKTFNINIVKPLDNNKTTKKPTEKKLPIKVKQSEVVASPINKETILPWLLVFLLSIALLYRSLKSKLKPAEKKSRQTSNTTLTSRQLKNNFKKACMENNAGDANQALLELAKIKWKKANIIQLADIQKLSSNMVFNNQIEILQQALYSTKTQWQGKQLWQAFLAVTLEKKRAKKKKTLLPKFN